MSGGKLNNIRQSGLDILKCICAFFVVWLHFGSYTYINSIMIAVSRVAVPVFFMITGYFYNQIIMSEKQIKQLKKITKMIIFSNILYLFINICACLFNGKSIAEFLLSDLSLKNIIKILLFNLTPFSSGYISASHLWYLSALLYVLLVALVLQRFNLFSIAYWCIPALLVGAIFLNNNDVFLMGNNRYFLYRNFIFFGIPFFLIGHYINRYGLRLRRRTTVFLSCLYLITVIFENQGLILLGLNGNREIYLGTPFAAVSVFLLFLTCYKDKPLRNSEKFLSVIGLKYSSGIYIIHRFVGFITDKFVNNLSIVHVYGYIRPIAVFSASLLTVWLFYFIIRVFKLAIKKLKRSQ